jgi:serine/threonine protein kinase
MGEVYRAADSHLKRSVAIKVLPASVAGDTDRLARFQREAEVLERCRFFVRLADAGGH